MAGALKGMFERPHNRIADGAAVEGVGRRDHGESRGTIRTNQARLEYVPGALSADRIISFAGWVARFGLRHRRRLYVDTAADELRGEDRFIPVGLPAGENNPRRFVPFMVRFHVHPDVQVTLAQDRRSVLLRAGPKDSGWWLRNDAGEVEIEPSIHFHCGQSRRASQIVLRGQVRIETGARIRWKLAGAEAWPPPR